jgi:outer membrane lipase/esterase
LSFTSTALQRPIRRLNTFVAALCLAAGTIGVAQAAPSYSNVYFFGDSLSDTGNAATLSGSTLPAGYATGQAVDNTGNGLWVNTFAAALGTNATNSLAGGNNFAYGGGQTGVNGGIGVPYLDQQVTRYLTRTSGAASSSALYVILMGGNDIASIIGTASTSANPAAAVTAGITAGMTSLSTQIQTLYGAGARNFLLFNAPDVLPTPRFQGVLASLPNDAARAGLTVLANQIVAGWNGAFTQTVSQLRLGLAGEDIDTVDLFGIGATGLANLTGLGYDGSTAPCYNNGVICANPSTRFFWDTFHPNSRVHLAVADAALHAIPVPGSLLLMSTGLLLLVAVGRSKKRMS